METTQIKTRIAQIDTERSELYRKGGKYMGSNGKPTSFVDPATGKYTSTTANGWVYIKARYADLMREREALIAQLAKAA